MESILPNLVIFDEDGFADANAIFYILNQISDRLSTVDDLKNTLTQRSHELDNFAKEFRQWLRKVREWQYLSCNVDAQEVTKVRKEVEDQIKVILELLKSADICYINLKSTRHYVAEENGCRWGHVWTEKDLLLISSLSIVGKPSEGQIWGIKSFLATQGGLKNISTIYLDLQYKGEHLARLFIERINRTEDKFNFSKLRSRAFYESPNPLKGQMLSTVFCYNNQVSKSSPSDPTLNNNNLPNFVVVATPNDHKFRLIEDSYEGDSLGCRIASVSRGSFILSLLFSKDIFSQVKIEECGLVVQDTAKI